jgi:glycosyltransferase involved in cell wall biosynthesis
MNPSEPGSQKTVLHIFSSLMPSGMEKMLYAAIEEFRKFNYEPVVLAQGDNHPYAENFSKKNVRTIIQHDFRSVQGCFDYFKNIRHVKPEIVHIHVESMHGVIALASKLFWPRSRVVITVHGYFDFVGFDFLKRVIQHRISNLVGSELIAVSQGIAKIELQRYKTKCLTIENWVSPDFSVGENVEEPSPDRKIRILVVGNCSPDKQHEVVLKAVHENDSLEIWHVGSEAKASKEEAKILDDLQDLEKLTRFGVTYETPAIMKACDAVAIPSKRESFSVVLAEALVSGKPTFISRIPGLTWAYDLPGVTLVESAEEWKSILQDINRQKLLDESKIAHQNAHTLKDRFSVKRGVLEYVFVYSSK